MATDKTILAIDPGTSCGWAVRKPDGSMISGVWNLKGSRWEGGGMRYLRLDRLLEDAMGNGAIGVVYYEEVRRHQSKGPGGTVRTNIDAAHIYGGITGKICEVCERRLIPYAAIPVGTIKKLATGKGNAGKPAMIAAARAKWPGLNPASDDEADARWIAEAGAAELKGGA